MKVAVVIQVSSAPGGLALALQTQALLLGHAGTNLQSIRLAIPRLLEKACLAAIAEGPDLLVVAGSPPAVRRAGQVAHERRVPVAFLPGIQRPQWTSVLWGNHATEELVAALAREEVSPIRLGVGSAAGQIFFEYASCGLLPQFARLRMEFAEAEGADEWFETVKRAAELAVRALRPKLCVRCDSTLLSNVSALTVTAQGFFGGAFGLRSVAHLQSFSCEAWRHANPLGLIGAAMRAVIGTDWTRGAQAGRFDCGQLCVEGEGPIWADLDGEPIRFNTPIAFHVLPRAVESVVFGSRQDRAGRDATAAFHRTGVEPVRPRDGWNRNPSSHVASFEFRGNGKGRA